jgi:uncharacterized protein (DUF2235 family)
MQRLVACADGTRQQFRYFPGVGTSRWERLRSGALGVGLPRSVKACYRWLAQQAAAPEQRDGRHERTGPRRDAPSAG